jgi:hypothetical protein
MIGNKTSGYTSWLARRVGVQPRPFEESRLKAIREKRRKYERIPFDGTDEDKAYMLGLKHGDLTVYTPWKHAIRVATSTTHPAMSNLFHRLFAPYGHVYEIPRFKKDQGTYEWNLEVILDETFAFLLHDVEETFSWICTSSSLFFSYLTGLIDADGSYLLAGSKSGKPYPAIGIFNSNIMLLDKVGRRLNALGYPSNLRMNKKKGTATRKYGIIHRKDYWQLLVQRAQTALNLTNHLHPRHPEKIRRRNLLLFSTRANNSLEVWIRAERLRTRIKMEVASYVRQAGQEYAQRHPPPSNS